MDESELTKVGDYSGSEGNTLWHVIDTNTWCHQAGYPLLDPPYANSMGFFEDWSSEIWASKDYHMRARKLTLIDWTDGFTYQ